MKILCYGDSNTWGQVPLTVYLKRRYPKSVRWPGVLETLGQGQLEIIEEGLVGRTTGPEDPVREGRSGLTYLQPCLDTHVPLDLIIFMLGSNDLKFKYRPSVKSIAERMRELVKLTQDILQQTGSAAKILVIAPVHPSEKSIFEDYRYDGMLKISQGLVEAYKAIASEEHVHFLDGTNFLVASPTDGLHLEQESHSRLAHGIFEKLKAIFSNYNDIAGTSSDV